MTRIGGTSLFKFRLFCNAGLEGWLRWIEGMHERRSLEKPPPPLEYEIQEMASFQDGWKRVFHDDLEEPVRFLLSVDDDGNILWHSGHEAGGQWTFDSFEGVQLYASICYYPHEGDCNFGYMIRIKMSSGEGMRKQRIINGSTSSLESNMYHESGEPLPCEDLGELKRLRKREPIGLGELRKMVKYFGFPGLPLDGEFMEAGLRYYLFESPNLGFDNRAGMKFRPHEQKMARRLLVTPAEYESFMEEEWEKCKQRESTIRKVRSKARKRWKTFVNELDERLREFGLGESRTRVCPVAIGVERVTGETEEYLRLDEVDHQVDLKRAQRLYMEDVGLEESSIPVIEATVHGLNQAGTLYISIIWRDKVREEDPPFTIVVDPKAATPTVMYLGYDLERGRKVEHDD